MKIDLGSGKNPFNPDDGWEHLDIDSKQLHVEYHSDAKNTSFESGSVDKLRASHILEHFSYADGEKALREWYRILKPEGMLEIIVPSVSWVMENYVKEGKIAFNALYGAQNTQYDVHKSGYTKEMIQETLRKAGWDFFIIEEAGGMIYAYCTKEAFEKVKPDTLKVAFVVRKDCIDRSFGILVENYKNGLLAAGVDTIVVPLEEMSFSGLRDRIVICRDTPWGMCNVLPGWANIMWIECLGDGIDADIHRVRRYAKFYDLAAVNNSFMMETAARLTGLPVFVMPGCYDEEKFTYRKKDLTNVFCFLAAGTQIRLGGWLVLEAFKIAFPKNVSDVRLDIIVYPGTEELVDKYKEDERIHFVKEYNYNDMPDVYAAANVFVRTSLIDGMPKSVLEAMAVGTPCIVTKGHSFLEFFNEDVGWMIDTMGRLEARDGFLGTWHVPGHTLIADAMRTAYTHRKSTAELGERASEYVKKFSSKVIARRIVPLFNDMLCDIDSMKKRFYLDGE